MSKWVVKAVVQKVLSCLPFGRHINYVLQKYVTGGVTLSEDYFFARLEHARHHLHIYSTHRNGKAKHYLELGSGWYPIIPVAFYLTGADSVFTIDIQRLYTKNRLLQTLEMFSKQIENGNVQRYITPIPERVSRLNQLLAHERKTRVSVLFRLLCITPLVGDAGKMELPADRFDLVTSNNTLQHIYRKSLFSILKNFRIAAKNGQAIHSHFIDMTDQFHHFDPSLSVYNFLRYSPAQWRWINNSIIPQNRLRLDDYRDLFAETGFRIVEEQNRPESTDEITSMNLHPLFGTKLPKINAIRHSHIVATSNEMSA